MILTNKYKLPEPFVNAVKLDDYNAGESDYTASQLPKSPRQVILQKRHDHEIVMDVSDLLWVLYGKAVHYILEKQEAKNAFQEERLYYKVADRIVSGQTDIYENGEIHDYKFTSVFAIVKGSQIPTWTAQVNTYAFLFRKHGFEVNNAEIMAMFRDWKKGRAATDKNYPKPVEKVKVDLWGEGKQYEWIKSRVELFKKNEKRSDDELDYCSEDDVWAEPTVYAVMKQGRKSAIKKHYDLKEAQEHFKRLALDNPTHTYYIETRPGRWKRCEDGWCPVAQFCNQFQEYKNSKQEAA